MKALSSLRPGLTLPLGLLETGTNSESGTFLVFSFDSFKIPSSAWYAINLMVLWSERRRASQSEVD